MSVESLGPYTLTLTEHCFPLAEDSLALASFATLRPGWPVCDLGCGGGTLLLLLARREPSLSLTGIERLPGPAETARRTLAQRGLFPGGVQSALFPGGFRPLRRSLPQ